MSTGAYREITPPVLATAPTFYLSGDEELFDALYWLDDSWANDSRDQLEVRIVKLEKFLQSKATKKFQTEEIVELKNDIAAAKETGEEYIRYHCF